MNQSLPLELEAHLRHMRNREECPAWLMLDAANRLLEWGGPVEHFGLDSLQPGDDATLPIPALTGLLDTPATEHISLPMIEITPDQGIAIDLFPASEGTHLLLRDVSADLRARRTLQQLANESRLLNERLQKALTQLEAANAELLHAKSQAEEASRAKSRFIASMSHELRTPLTAILGYASLLQTPDRPPNPFHVRAIQRSGNHLLSMIDNMLDEGMLASGQLHARPESIAADKVIDEAAAVLRESARSRSIEILHHTPRMHLPVRIWADPIRLRQVLINLIDNAIKYGREGGKVRIHTTADANTVIIEVADNGPGITPALRPSLFTPFQRGKYFSEVRGTGLGLAIARQLVELMQGRLELMDTPREGAVFRITLPRARPPEHITNRKPAARILIVEDDPDIRDLIGIHLHAANFRVLAAETGQEAIAKTLNDEPDLVLLDLHLPDLNGTAVLQRLRALPFRGPVVALTATALRERLDAALAAGFDDYATKPLDFARLANQIHELIKAHD